MPPPAAPPAIVQAASLTGVTGFRIDGTMDFDRLGYGIASAGDVNADGIDDLIVGDLGTGANNEGAAYVLFGSAAGFPGAVSPVDLDGGNGFALIGTSSNQALGRAVSGAGDINGDGIDDLAVALSGGMFREGRVYVLFGRSTGFDAVVSGPPLDDEGVMIMGARSGENIGNELSAAGDLNGDGIGDLLIAARGGVSAYVLFGQDSGFASVISAADLTGSTGFRLDAENRLDLLGVSVRTAGDLNGDGFDDMVVGARNARGSQPYAGAAYVVYGGGDGHVFSSNVTEIQAATGATLLGQRSDDFFGNSVAGGGDVNGDGFDDLVIGAYQGDSSASDAGSAYVIFGRSGGLGASVDMSTLDGRTGFRLDGAAENDNAGLSVAIAGDVNGDGFDDLLIGAYAADPNGRDSGTAYVVFGARQGFSPVVNLSTLNGQTGFAIHGEAAGDELGTVVAAAGDLNNDGFDDVVVGAPNHNSLRGAVYVIYGRATGAIDRDGTEAAEILAGGDWDDNLRGLGGNDTIRGNGGNDTLYGGAGIDLLDGGLGNDTFILGRSADRVTDAGGHDRIQSAYDRSLADYSGIEDLELTGTDAITGIGDAGANRISGNSGANRIAGGGGNDTLTGGAGADRLGGGTGADRIRAGGGNDTLRGGAGDDVLRGKTGNDRLLDGAGRDTLIGDAGADVLQGGIGRDLLRGGAGRDDFVFRSAAEAKGDRIAGFRHGIDDIDLRGFMRGGSFIGSDRFTGDEDEVRYMRGSGVLMGDVDGDGRADWRLTITNRALLTEDDFLF